MILSYYIGNYKDSKRSGNSYVKSCIPCMVGIRHHHLLGLVVQILAFDVGGGRFKPTLELVLTGPVGELPAK